MSDITAATRAIPLPSAEINLGGTSTNEVFFKTVSAQNGVPAASTLVCYMPGSNVMKDRPFKVIVGGRVTVGSTGNFTASLYWGTTSLSASNVKIATGVAGIGSGVSTNWQIIFEGMWDSTSGQIVGVQRGWVAAKIISVATITASAATVDLSGESTSNGFTCTGTFSVGSATSAATITTFEVEAN